jgi:hypothetical protein
LLVGFIVFCNLTTLACADTQTRPAPGSVDSSAARYHKPPAFIGERFARTELYFGTGRPNGQPPVSDAEFQGFLDDTITPSFPDGLTVLKGLGQFRGADGITIEEDSFLVILLYPTEVKRDNSAKIEAIRDAYKTRFQQESVLRSDRCCERVSF